jgi:hypothetical protein
MILYAVKHAERDEWYMTDENGKTIRYGDLCDELFIDNSTRAEALSRRVSRKLNVPTTLDVFELRRLEGEERQAHLS